MIKRPKKFVKEITQKPQKPKTSSWGGVASWYDDYLENNPDNYQEQVIAPNLFRILDINRGEKIIDVACGQGFFSRKFSDAGAEVTGADISPELIKAAKIHAPKIRFEVAPAHQLSFAHDGEFDTATIVLAIQNIENMEVVFAEVGRILKPSGRFILVLNHPAFRIPKRSSWGFDERAGIQYRRVDSYLSQSSVPIVMHPGEKKSESTVSFHRSLQDFFKALTKNGFVISKLEEWISHKQSQKGPRQKAEDDSRKEIPLFLMLEARKSS